MPSASGVQNIPLHEAATERYINYALSVITSRALPDVRDGLKPVQRRILYTMFHEMSLHPGGRYRKCAAIVGEVMGKFHPHGDQSIYDALVRMAQDFSLRAPWWMARATLVHSTVMAPQRCDTPNASSAPWPKSSYRKFARRQSTFGQTMMASYANRLSSPHNFRSCSSTVAKGSRSDWQHAFPRTTWGRLSMRRLR